MRSQFAGVSRFHAYVPVQCSTHSPNLLLVWVRDSHVPGQPGHDPLPVLSKPCDIHIVQVLTASALRSVLHLCLQRCVFSTLEVVPAEGTGYCETTCTY